MSRDHAIITGGAGFIGSHLAEHLLDAGVARRLTLIDNLSTGRRANLAALPADRFELIEARASEALPEVLARDTVSADTPVFHLAASVGVALVVEDPAAMLHNNLGETTAVLDACARAGSRGRITSSSEVYGTCPEVPLTEETPLVFGPTTESRWSYGMAKALDEHLALAMTGAGAGSGSGLRPVIVRLFNTVGPRQVGRYGMVVPRFVAAAASGQPLELYGGGEQTRSFCDVRDVVRALAGLMAEPAAVGGVFNIGGPEEITIRALAEAVVGAATEAGVSPASRLETIPYQQVYGANFGDPPRRRPATDKIRALLGWQPEIPLEQTLAELMGAAQASSASQSGEPAGPSGAVSQAGAGST